MELFIHSFPLSAHLLCTYYVHQWKKIRLNNSGGICTQEDIQSLEQDIFVFRWVSGLEVHSYLSEGRVPSLCGLYRNFSLLFPKQDSFWGCGPPCTPLWRARHNQGLCPQGCRSKHVKKVLVT